MCISYDKTQVILCQSMRPIAPLMCQSLPLSFTNSYWYLGQDVWVSQRLLTDLALMQVTSFQWANLHLHHAATQPQLSAPRLWVLLVQSLCISHLLTGCMVLCPMLPVQFTLCPPYGSHID